MTPRTTKRLAQVSAAALLTLGLLLAASSASDAAGPLQDVLAPPGVELAAACQGENGTNYSIEDGLPKMCGDYTYSTVVISCAECELAVASSVVVDYTIRHTAVGQLQVWLCNGTGTCVMLWDHAGGGDDDIIVTNLPVSALIGQAVDQAWSLRAWDCAAGGVGYIDWWRITVNYTFIPTPSSPANGSSTCDATPQLCWSAIPGAVNYHLRVDNQSTFSSPEFSAEVGNVTCYSLESALAAGTYYWQVAAYVSACPDEGGWSSARSFTILPTPAAPTLSSPASGSSTCGTTPQFCWGAVSGAMAYWLSVDNNSNFSSPEIGLDVGNVTCYTPATPLAPGAYYWEITAWDSCWGLWSATRSFTILPSPPPAPALSAPANGSSTCNGTPQFCWGVVSGTTMYRIQVADNSSFVTPEFDAVSSSACYTFWAALAPGLHYWRVNAIGSCGTSAWSAARSFAIVVAPAAPVLSSPGDGICFCDATPTFSWNAAAGAASYRLQVDNNNDFSSPEVDQTLAGTSYTAATAFAKGYYRWRVMASNVCGASEWSAVRGMKLDVSLPALPALSAPADGSSTGDATPTFSWGAAALADTYWLQVDDDSGFGSPEAESRGWLLTSYTPSTALSPGVYYWHVRAYNNCGLSDWSAVRQLTVLSPIATPTATGTATRTPTLAATVTRTPITPHHWISIPMILRLG